VLKIRFHFDGKCRIHPRYNPKDACRPPDPQCPGCESLRVIDLYTRIAERRACEGDGIETSYRRPTQPRPEIPASANSDLSEAEETEERSDSPDSN
jgi:hypothetical protein